MKKHSWVGNNSMEDSIEITVRDYSGARIESWKINPRDKKNVAKVFRRISQKYGINLFIEKKRVVERDLEWIK